MLHENTAKKLIELASRAVSVNEELLSEEKNFIKAVAANEDRTTLLTMADRIEKLFRKEGLFIGAAKSLLDKD